MKARFTRIWYWLVGPHPRLLKVDERRTARLLASLLLAYWVLSLFSFLAAELFFATFAGGISLLSYRDTQIILAGSGVVIFWYLLVRMGYYKLGAILYIVDMALIALVSPFVSAPNIWIGDLALILIPVFVAALVFSARGVAIVWFLILTGGVYQLARIDPSSQDLATGLTLLFVSTVTGFGLVVLRRHCQLLEQDRVQALEHSQATLRSSEALLSSALQVACMGTWEYDVETGLFTFNDQYYRLHDLTVEEAGGYQLSAQEFAARYVHPEDAFVVSEVIEQAIRTDDPNFQVQMERRILKKDTTPVWVKVWFRIEKDEQGRTVRLHGVNQDITDNKRIYEQLQVALEKYKVLFESFPMGISITNSEGRIIETNREAERLLGVPRDEHESRTYDSDKWRIIRPNGTIMLPEEFASVRALKENRLVENVEMGIVKGEDLVTWISVTAAPIPHKDYGVAIAYGDITEKKLSKDALQQSHRRLQSQLIEIAMLKDALQEQAVRDHLTGLFNRRYLIETLHKELSRAVREKYSVSLVMLDIDHFKAINDTYGHAAGDSVLQRIARELQVTARAEDMVCRYGGEEFIVILHNTTAETAIERANQWREAIDIIQTPYEGHPIHVTLSVGVSVFPDHAGSVDVLIRAADEALYRAKMAGRNCVCL